MKAQEAEKGDDRAIGTVSARLEDDDGDVREAAAQAFAEKGDNRAIGAVSARLEDENWHVRQAALKGLGYADVSPH